MYVYKFIACYLVTKENLWFDLMESWIRSACVLKNVIDTKKCHWWSYYFVHFLMSEYLSYYWKNMLTRVNNKTVLFNMTVLFYLPSKKYISNISNIYNPDENLSLAFQTICEHIFQIRSRIILFIFFGYVNGLYIFSSHMFQLFA